MIFLDFNSPQSFKTAMFPKTGIFKGKYDMIDDIKR